MTFSQRASRVSIVGGGSRQELLDHVSGFVGGPFRLRLQSANGCTLDVLVSATLHRVERDGTTRLSVRLWARSKRTLSRLGSFLRGTRLCVYNPDAAGDQMGYLELK